MRLLVIDDAPDIATLLKLAFRSDGYAVDTALTGAEADELAWSNAYDVLILDLNLPDCDGLDLCRNLRKAFPQLLIIVLSARAGHSEIVRGLDAGADDYLTKPFDYLELVARVRALLRRDMRVRQPILICGDLRLDPASGDVWQGDRQIALPRKQLRILEYLMRHRGEIVSQEQLLEHVWNSEINVLTNTVRVQINWLRQALRDTAGCPRYLETLIGVGYRLDDIEQRGQSVTETLSQISYPRMEATYAQDERREAMTGMPKVLLVDDAADICQLLIVHYAGKSYGVRVAYDGASALALAERDLPDLVILDLGLPDLDGLEVCRRLRRASAVPIVILTRRSDNAARDAGIAAGAIAYLTKPFEISDLDAAVDAALAR